MLIVNADDFGANVAATDRAIEAFDAGVISSASAMVWMRGSQRAARLGRERGLPLGVHLNFTLAFDAPDVPRAARERQQQLMQVFSPNSWRQDEASGAPAQLVRDAVSDQLHGFIDCYGEPTHLDGHHHVHVHSAVLEALPTSRAIRGLLRDAIHAGDESSARERVLHERFRAPRLTLDFGQLHPMLGGIGFGVLGRADHEWTEVMCHPHIGLELDALLSPQWRAVIARLPVGSFAGLARGG